MQGLSHYRLSFSPSYIILPLPLWIPAELPIPSVPKKIDDSLVLVGCRRACET